MQDNTKYQTKTYSALNQPFYSNYFNNPSQNMVPNKNDKRYTLQNEEKRSVISPIQSKMDLTPTKTPDQPKQSGVVNANPNILKGNVSFDNLLKTDSIGKTNFNINEINQKNKEIMTMEQRIKQMPMLQRPERQTPPTVINNYGGNQAAPGMGGMHRTDPLIGIKNTMRSLPSWRTEMG